jgi:predicted sulfurtransferase
MILITLEICAIMNRLPLIVFGEYIAHEGINVHISITENNLQNFLNGLIHHEELAAIPIKYAIEDDSISFYKTAIKARPKIVADELDD